MLSKLGPPKASTEHNAAVLTRTSQRVAAIVTKYGLHDEASRCDPETVGVSQWIWFCKR